MRNFFSIAHKITLQLILTGIFATIILGTYAYYASGKAMLDRTYEQLTSVRTEKQNRLESFFTDRKRELKHISNLPETKKYLKKEYPSDLAKAPPDFLFNNYINSLYYIPVNSRQCIRFIHQGVKAIQSTEATPDWLPQNLETISDIQIIDYTKNQKNKYVFHMLSLVKSEDSIIGIIAIDISQDFINEIMFENNPHNGLGNSGEAYLVGCDSLMRSTSRFQKEAVMKISVKTAGVHKALSKQTGTDIFPDYRGTEVISSYAPLEIKNLNWAILAEIDLSEAMIPIHDLRNKFLFLGVLVASLLFVLAWFLSRWLSRPIIALNNASKMLSEGGLPKTVEVKSNDEISDLAAQFNEMAKKIHEQTQNLRLSKIRSLRSMIDGQEKERQRLSRELHDSLGQMLIALKLKYQSETDENASNELLKLIDQTIEETRRLSNDLKPAELDEFGLNSALERLCKTGESISKLKIYLDTEALPSQMSRKLQTYIYRIVQEGIHNIIKHAEAENAEIIFQTIDDELIILIKDDGKGMTDEPINCNQHHGLKNLEDRANILGGEIQIKSREKSGTKLIISLPINHKTHE
ncbi:MAG: HAMP domain-containing protein [Bacteroidales bacterium]|jgi:two-component system NarL family sensor kinase|nr:HAMP domain-containing protein [Bacteroidales bacterium]